MTTIPTQGATLLLSDQIAEEIRAELGRQRMSQRKLAAMLGVSPAWINFRLTGVQEIGLNDLARICAAINVPVTRIMAEALRTASRSQGSGATGDRPAQTIVRVDSDLQPRAVARPARASSHVATRTGPLSHGRRDATRPVSAVPANLRRPSPTRPPARPTPR